MDGMEPKLTPETKAEIISSVKLLVVSLTCIIGMMFASLWFIPIAFEAYENEAISLDVYYIITYIPIVNIGVVLIGTGLYMHYRWSDSPEPRKHSTTKPQA